MTDAEKPGPLGWLEIDGVMQVCSGDTPLTEWFIDPRCIRGFDVTESGMTELLHADGCYCERWGASSRASRHADGGGRS